ncbi:MAG: hypothetical protein IIB02_08410 [Thaumarchaeota archaeon]|nr:hypothetical protein [Nitrososphaerota archaeon]
MDWGNFLQAERRDSTTKLIKAKKVSLTDSFDEYVANSAAPKWICKECYDCGIILF